MKTLDSMPDVEWEDSDIIRWAEQHLDIKPKTYVELTGAFNRATADIAIIHFDRKHITVERVNQKRLNT